MRRPSKFTKSDVTRAVRAVCGAGLPVARVEINRDGMIVVIPANPKQESSINTELDNWVKKNHADSA
jgi:hypothetical protein